MVLVILLSMALYPGLFRTILVVPVVTINLLIAKQLLLSVSKLSQFG
jgi:hypothetical protein